jgi:hypothetical protein
MEQMDVALQDARVVEKIAESHAAGDNTDGIAAGKITKLKNAIADAEQKDTAQKKAIQSLSDMTAQQNAKIAEGADLISTAQKAAKAAFGAKDAQKMKEFHIGMDVPKTVKGLTSELKYFRSITTKYAAELAPEGFKDTQSTALDALITDLPDTDVEQEKAKKAQVNATAARDEALAALKEAVRSVRKSAEAIFRKQPDVLKEFARIPEGRGAAKKAAAPTADTKTATAAPKT